MTEEFKPSSCGVPMSIVIDPNGKMGTDAWLEEDDVERYKIFLESIGYKIDIERSDKSFKDEPALFKRKMVKDIDWANPKMARIILENEQLSDDKILQKMGVIREEGSGVVITFRVRSIRQDFLKWAELEKIEKSSHMQYYDRFSKIYAKTQKKNIAGTDDIKEPLVEELKK